MTIPEPISFEPEGPQPLVAAIPAGRPYPIEALGPLQEVVEAVHGAVQAPVAIPAQSALSVASLAVQGFADVETLGGPRPTSLYAMTVAQSGERKSSCDDFLMAELRAYEREKTDTMRLEMAKWENKRDLWQDDKDRLRSVARKSTGTERTAALADLDALGPEPVRPLSAERTVTEPTYEGLTRKFHEGHPSLGIFADEGGQFLGGHAMSRDNRQKTLAALNDLWQGKPIKRTRSSDTSFTLHGRRLAVHLMAQPGVARSFISDPMTTDTGFLARFLCCEPPSTIGTRFYGAGRYDPNAIDRFNMRLREILETDLPMDPETWALSPRTLPMSHEARSLLIKFHDETETKMAPGGKLEHVVGAAAKAAEHAARIAGVLTLWRNLDAPHVGKKEMANAIALAKYYLSEAVRLASAAKISEGFARAETLRKWIIERWPEDEILLSDVLQRGPTNELRDSKTARAALALLQSHGWLVPLEAGTVVQGKTRREAWRVVRV